MPKKVLTTKEEKAPFFEGLNILANLVGSTLGPKGKVTIISQGYGRKPFPSKDGVTNALNIQLEDEIMDAGANYIKAVSEKSVADSGDGTSTASVLAQSMINKWLEVDDGSLNPQKVKEGLDAATEVVVNKLKEMSVAVGDDNDKIKNVATISANNDTFIGGIIADAYKQIGNKGLLLIEESGTVETKIDVVEGSVIPKGYYSDHFVNDKEKARVVYENPFFIVLDYEVKKMAQLIPIIQELNKENGGNIAGVPIVIYAHDFEGEVHGTCIMNNTKNGTKLLLMKAPTSYRKESLHDVAMLTGATLICDEAGLKVDQTLLVHLGQSEKIIVTGSNTTIIRGNVDKDKLEAHKKNIQAQIDNSTDVPFKEVYEKRLAQISGSIGIIKVGGSTDVEMKEKKDRVDDAVRATKCAIEMGVLTGGGVSLIRCIKELDKLNTHSYSETIGVDIIKNALLSPLQKMIENSGDSYPILSKVMEANGNFGYNIKTEKFEDLFEAGVIDATKVVISALMNASSVAAQIVTSGSFVVEVAKK